jgi:hypothetical protein
VRADVLLFPFLALIVEAKAPTFSLSFADLNTTLVTEYNRAPASHIPVQALKSPFKAYFGMSLK